MITGLKWNEGFPAEKREIMVRGVSIRKMELHKKTKKKREEGTKQCRHWKSKN